MTNRPYIVTIRPKHQTYAGSWASGEYTIEVFAKDRADAIKRARRGYEDSRTNPAAFTARLAPMDRDGAAAETRKKGLMPVCDWACCSECGWEHDRCRCSDNW